MKFILVLLALFVRHSVVAFPRTTGFDKKPKTSTTQQKAVPLDMETLRIVSLKSSANLAESAIHSAAASSLWVSTREAYQASSTQWISNTALVALSGSLALLLIVASLVGLRWLFQGLEDRFVEEFSDQASSSSQDDEIGLLTAAVIFHEPHNLAHDSLTHPRSPDKRPSGKPSISADTSPHSTTMRDRPFSGTNSVQGNGQVDVSHHGNPYSNPPNYPHRHPSL